MTFLMALSRDGRIALNGVDSKVISESIFLSLNFLFLLKIFLAAKLAMQVLLFVVVHLLWECHH